MYRPDPLLTKNAKAEVECDDNHLSVTGQGTSLVRIARVPRERLAMYEEQNWIVDHAAAGQVCTYTEHTEHTEHTVWGSEYLRDISTAIWE